MQWLKWSLRFFTLNLLFLFGNYIDYKGDVLESKVKKYTSVLCSVFLI